MSPTPLTLVIDQGTHATRAFAFDRQGGVRASAFCPISLHRRSPDVIEQDAGEIEASMRKVVKELLADPAVRRLGVVRAALATQRSSVVAWHSGTGEPLSPVLTRMLEH